MNIECDKTLETDWKECLDWIKRCGFLISKDATKSTMNSALFLLFEMIDGILPLNILQRLSQNKIDISKIREYNSSPKDSQFHCVKNLKLFNKLCVEYFDVTEIDLVEAGNVYYGREFGKFILLLSKISKSKYAKSSGIIGFPIHDHPINSQHEYYNVLDGLVAKSFGCQKRSYENVYDEDESATSKKVYESLVEHRQTVMTPVVKSTRDMCIHEIVESEKNYLDSLNILVKGYKVPLRGYLSEDELSTIFRGIEDLCAIHTEFYENIKCAIMPRGVNIYMQKLHDVFIGFKRRMLIYGQYCANIQIARNLLQDMIKTNSVKRVQLERCQEFSKKFRQFALSELLTLPIQRVLKYHLLVQVLLKNTEETHEDYQGLKSAHEAMLDLSQFVNDVKRDQEAIISIDKIQGEMHQIHLPTNKKLSDYGRSQKDGELKVQLDSDHKPRLRHIFVFDKMILIAQRKNENYSFKYAFYLQDKRPEEVNVVPKKPEKLYPFTVSVRGGPDNVQSIILYPKSEETRSQWISAVDLAIQNQYPSDYNSNGHFFVMTTFSKYEECDFCKKLLSGAFYQGYLCKKTGKMSHKACIPLIVAVSGFVEESNASFSAFDTCRQGSEDNFFFNENSHYRPEPLRDYFNMTPFQEISQTNKDKSQQRIELYDNEPWYVGEMEREDANNLLENCSVGTFLIRLSKNRRRAGEYSLSVMDNEPKHMKIQKNSSDGTYFLEDANKFHDLRDLVKFYSQICLNEFFDRLKVPNLKLTTPMKSTELPLIDL